MGPRPLSAPPSFPGQEHSSQGLETSRLPKKSSNFRAMGQGNASQKHQKAENQEVASQESNTVSAPVARTEYYLDVAQVDSEHAPSPSMPTGLGIFGSASTVNIDGTPSFNVVGRDFYNIINHNYDQVQENLKILKKKLNPIINPVKKQIYCAEGTRVQLLNDVCEWVLKPNSYIAWIHGLAGSGKSAVAVSLAEKLRTMDSQVTLALTFHCVKGQETSNTLQLVPTICYHLAQCYPQFAKALIDVFEKDASLFAESIPIREQLSHFMQPLYGMHQTQYAIIVIDGLDEWGKPEDQHILLVNLAHHLQKIGWIHIILTSRPEGNIVRAVNLNSSTAQSFSLTDDYPAEKDIARFFRMYFSKRIPQETFEHWVDALTEKAGNLFIWATTAVKYLDLQYNMIAGINTLLNPKSKANTGDPYVKLYNLYATVLHNHPRIDSELGIQLFQLVIGAITSAYEPLTVKTLAKMLEQQSQVTIDYSMIDSINS
ncbi:hypothetical protein D9757_009090 [Collybiopsis confluens]|uniref:Nephrocystin 3-like N-terminal domain-containing protein n=1 Tax=Collybiopsis confluens TaxID=2823264 RepID=A0A8H5H925_9AGAR|nr:hypothetical protein D9757_009090 [Collybiopsis confluens]